MIIGLTVAQDTLITSAVEDTKMAKFMGLFLFFQLAMILCSSVVSHSFILLSFKMGHISDMEKEDRAILNLLLHYFFEVLMSIFICDQVIFRRFVIADLREPSMLMYAMALINMFNILFNKGFYVVLDQCIEWHLTRNILNSMETIEGTPVGDNDKCYICESQFDSEDINVKRASCGHVFHHFCIREWMRFSKMCPECDKLLSPELAPEKEECSEEEMRKFLKQRFWDKQCMNNVIDQMSKFDKQLSVYSELDAFLLDDLLEDFNDSDDDSDDGARPSNEWDLSSKLKSDSKTKKNKN